MNGEENQINTGETASFRIDGSTDRDVEGGDISFAENRQNTPFGDDPTLACSHHVAPTSSQTDIPRQLGRYEVRQLVGRGGFGAVYLGWDPQLEREVAIKIPRFTNEAGTNASTSDKQQAAQLQEDFLREARKAVRLERHAGIVPVYDTGVENGVCYIVSQYIDGGTLRQLKQKGALSTAESLLLMARIAETIEFAHQHGWVHRDIKPSNILIDQQGNPYLTDFGLTATVEELRADAGPQQGTPNYMAPELARHVVAYMNGKPVADASNSAGKASDIYSMGVVLFELLTGNLPFDGGSYKELFEKVLKSPAPSLDEAGLQTLPQLNRVCQQALAKEPEERFQSAAEFAAQLKALAGAIEHQQQPQDTSLTRGRMQLLAAAGVIVLLLAGLAIAASSGWLQSPSQQETGDPAGGPVIAMAVAGEAEENPLKHIEIMENDPNALDKTPPADSPIDDGRADRMQAIRKIEKTLAYDFDQARSSRFLKANTRSMGQPPMASPAQKGPFARPKGDRQPGGISARPANINPSAHMPLAIRSTPEPQAPPVNLQAAVLRYESYELPKLDPNSKAGRAGDLNIRHSLTADVLQLAGSEVAAGKLNTAAEALETVKRRPLSAAPNLTASRITLEGDIAFKKAEFSTAMQLYDAALQATSNAQNQMQIRLRRLRVLLATGQQQKADQETAAIRNSIPADSPVNAMLKSLYEQGDEPPPYDEPPEPAGP